MQAEGNRQYPLYTPMGIAVGTALGSLIAGVFMLWLNYQTLGYGKLGARVAGGGVILYLIIIGTASILPDGLVIGLVFVVAQALAAYGCTVLLQGKAIDYHVTRGGPVHNLLRAGLVGLVAGLVVVLALLILGQAFDLPIAMGG